MGGARVRWQVRIVALHSNVVKTFRNIVLGITFLLWLFETGSLIYLAYASYGTLKAEAMDYFSVFVATGIISFLINKSLMFVLGLVYLIPAMIKNQPLKSNLFFVDWMFFMAVSPPLLAVLGMFILHDFPFLVEWFNSIR